MTVYFAERCDTGAVKIGFVTDHHSPGYRRTAAEYRRTALEKHLGVPVHFVALTSGRRFVERWFHRRHEAAGLGHEWFAPSDALLSDIACLGSGARIDGQPLEPAADWLPPQLIRYWRETYFRLCQRIMAERLGLSLTGYRAGECYGSSILRVIDIARVSDEDAAGLTLPRMIADAEQIATFRVAA